MPKKSCKHCGIVNFNHVCPVVAKEQNARDAKRSDKKVYWDKRWRMLRADVLQHQLSICLWSLYVEGIIKPAYIGHHIIEVMVDKTRVYDIDNVIGLGKDAHEEVHRLYLIDKSKTMKRLEECKRLWDSGVRFDGLGILRGK
jgi:hypothetical protein